MAEGSQANAEYPGPNPSEPPLHRAARTGDHAGIRRLIAAGADINALFDLSVDPGKRGRCVTPLMVAAGSSDGASDDTVRLLLELGADPKMVVGAFSAATCAFEGLGWSYKPGGDAKRAKLLLDAGSPLPSSRAGKNRLLSATAVSGDPSRLTLLLADGWSPHGYWDAESAKDAYRRVLERCPASVSEDYERSMFDRMSSGPSAYEIPLFQAAQSGNAACVRLLLDAGADVKVRDQSKRTAMYSANSAEVVQELMRAGLALEDADEFGWSPLVNAVGDGEGAIPRIRALIESGADVNAAHDQGYTVFMSAVGSGRHLGVLRLLVASGADPHAVSDFGYNAFHAAIDVNGEANSEESVRETFGYLKELGVNIEHRNNAGQTPLARAIQSGTGIEVRVLCDLGADPNGTGPKYDCRAGSCLPTRLSLLFHAAAGVGVHMDTKVEALLKAGAEPLVVDAEGFSPLMHVVSSLSLDASEPSVAYQAFFTGLKQLRLDEMSMPQSQESFLAAVMQRARPYVERFAGDIPMRETTEFAERWRTEKVSCIVLLCAYEGWARWRHGKAREP